MKLNHYNKGPSRQIENEASFLPEVNEWLYEKESLSPETYEIAEYAAGRILLQDAFRGVKNPRTGESTTSLFNLKLKEKLFIPILIISIIWSLSLVLEYKKLSPPSSYTAEATGVVTENELTQTVHNPRDKPSRVITTCRPKYSFTPNNKQEKIEGSPNYQSDNYCSLNEGDSVTILYDPTDPHSNTIKNLGGLSTENLLLWVSLFPFVFLLPTYHSKLWPVLRQGIAGWRLVRKAPKKEYWSSEDKRLELEFQEELTKTLIQFRLEY